MPIHEQAVGKNRLIQSNDTDGFIGPRHVIETWKDGGLLLRHEAEGVAGFRLPQLGAIYAVLSHWTKSEQRATVVLPTGTGKTETMLALLVLAKCERLLVLVPTDPLREQIADKFVGLGLLKEPMGVLGEEALSPVVGLLKSKILTTDVAEQFFPRCNVIVSTVSLISKLPAPVLEALVATVSHVFIDEAHHAEAATWSSLRDQFAAKRTIQFTATPYRNDRARSKTEIIYNYPLSKAQAEGYFKQIEFNPIYEFDPTFADRRIADEAVRILRDDRKEFPHILLARVASKSRADQVAAIYGEYDGLSVAKIYSGISGKEALKTRIKNKEFEVIVCVDMLGEGFDLPELKIAAFHDVKKSLPTTIQFVGRFTRTKFDQELGNAKVIVNLADLKVEGELDQLYAQDKDWNELLPRFSEARTQEEIDFHETVAGFANIDDFFVSVYDLRPAMSTVVYRNHLKGWNIENFQDIWNAKKRFEIVKTVTNDDKKILVMITAEKTRQKWTDSLELFDVAWTFTLIHWNQELNLLFIHSSDKGSLHEDAAATIVGEEASIINGDNAGEVFRCLDGIHRYRMQNVGLKELIGKLRRFRMSVGTDIGETLTRAEITQATKSHVFGSGYEHGEPTTLGCSYKGRIWAQLQNDIDTFIKWCANVGRKLNDPDIDAEQVLRGAIVPRSVAQRPAVFPICIAWSPDMYKEMETRYRFRIGAQTYEFFNCDLVLIDPSENGNIRLGLEAESDIVAEFVYEIFTLDAPRTGNDFRIVQTEPAEPVVIEFGAREQELKDFFYSHTPEIWFADGSVLEGVALAEPKEDLTPFPAAAIQSWDWNGISLSTESQGIDPKVVDSIQYRCIQILCARDYEIVYDDDYSGEMADIVAIKELPESVSVELYHLKGVPSGQLSGSVTNLYEVCGQAQKSAHWRYKDNTEFVSHLLRRQQKTRHGLVCSRLEKGSLAELTRILQLARSRKPFTFKIIAVQPALTSTNASENSLRVLAVTDNFIKQLGVDFEVVGS